MPLAAGCRADDDEALGESPDAGEPEREQAQEHLQHRLGGEPQIEIVRAEPRQEHAQQARHLLGFLRSILVIVRLLRGPGRELLGLRRLLLPEVWRGEAVGLMDE